MTKEIRQIKAQIREDLGKGASRALRNEGKIPAILYGADKPEVKITIDLKELLQEYNTGKFRARLYELDLGKEKQRVVSKDVQLHPVTDVPLHVDFMRVNPGQKIKVFITIRFLNADKSPGIKRGGVLSIVRRKIELLCDVDSIPEILEYDLTGKMIGDSIHVSMLNLPEGAKPTITDRDFTIATIVGRKIQTASEAEGEDEEGSEEGQGKEGSSEDSSEE